MIALFLTTDRLKSVKATWDHAPEGPKKVAALAYYQIAERAHIAQRDGDCVRALDAVVIALR
jgi:hypothetical protein